MSCLGKTIGFIVGLLLGNLPGAIIGFLLGHFLYDVHVRRSTTVTYDTSAGNSPSMNEEYRLRFISLFSSMVAKIAKADGQVTEREIETVDHAFTRILNLSPEMREFAVSEFRKAKDSPEHISQYANEFVRITGGNTQVCASMLEMLKAVAASDGVISEAEGKLLTEVADILGVYYSHSTTSGSSASPRTHTLKDDYEMLGVD
ncbi:MAG: TerB family tellurite resistance protein [Planctomycetota bacterium]|nr:TerB family tellurite resistance protein [Planctomycetota bacterium]